MMQDDRTNAQALAGLFDTDMLMSNEFSKASPAPEPAPLLVPPKSLVDQMDERHGKFKSRLGLFSHLLGGGTADDYGDDDLLAKHAAEKSAYAMAQKMAGYQPGFDLLMNGVDDPQDAIYRAMYAKEFGLDNLAYAMNGGVVTPEPDWEKVDIDGQYFYTDKNDPTAAPVPVTMEDGSFATLICLRVKRKTLTTLSEQCHALSRCTGLKMRASPCLELSCKLWLEQKTQTASLMARCLTWL